MVARPCLEWRLLAADGQSWVMRLLAARPWGGGGRVVPGLVLAHWWAELGSGGVVAELGVSGLVSAC